MDFMQIVMLGLGVACGILGWFARELYNAVQQLRKDISALEIKIGTDYIRYDRLHDALKPIMDNLHEIKDTLKGKADK